MEIKAKNSYWIKKVFILFALVFYIKSYAQVNIATPAGSDTNYVYCTETTYSFSVFPSVITIGYWSTLPSGANINEIGGGNEAIITFTTIGSCTINLLYSTQMNGGNKHSVKTIVKIDSCSNVGISAITNKTSDIKIYPNPAQNKLTIDIGNTESQQLTLFDLTGKQILQQIIKEITVIDVSAIEDGIYFLRLKSSTGTMAQKIIVHH